MIDTLTYLVVLLAAVLPLYLCAYLALVKKHLWFIAGFHRLPASAARRFTTARRKRIGWWCFAAATIALVAASTLYWL